MSNPKNLLTIYLQVLLGYIIFFIALISFFTIVLGLMSGWQIILILALIKNQNGYFPLDSWIATIAIFAISSFFSALEVKRFGLGWFTYGILLFVRFYYFQHLAEWNKFPEYVRTWWDFVLIIHPVIHYFFGGKFAERFAMTNEQREEDYQNAYYAAYHAACNEYNSLSYEARNNLYGYGISNAHDYAERKMNR